MEKLLGHLTRREAARWRWILPLLCGLFIILPNLWPTSKTLGENSLEVYEAVIYSILFWVLLLALCGRSWLALLLATIPATWWGCCLFLRITYRTPFNQTFLGMVADTSFAEIYDFLSSYGFHWLLLALLPVFLFPVFSAYLACYPETPWPRAWRPFALLISALAFIVPAALYYSIDEVPLGNCTSFSEDCKDAFNDPGEDIADRFFSFYPLDFPAAAWRFTENMKQLKGLRKSIQPLVLLEQGEKAPEIVLLVIGESSNVMRWSLFGYGKQTNPLLQEQSGIIPFSRVASASIATRHAVPAILSRRPAMRHDGSVSSSAEASILELFGQAGYQTYWVSNQSSSGFHDSPIALYAAEAQREYYTNVSAYNMKGTFDEVALNRVKQIMSNEPGRKMIVLHTMGSHFNYAHRYPQEFDIFRPSMDRNLRFSRSGEESDGENISNSEIISNSYDNTIVYTDYILNAAIEALKAQGKSAVMVFSSDHGEDVPGDACNFKRIAWESIVSYRVPTLIWLSEAYRNDHRGVAEGLSANSARAWMNDDLPQTLLDLAFIKCAGERTRSLLDKTTYKARPAYHGTSFESGQGKDENSCRIKQ